MWALRALFALIPSNESPVRLELPHPMVVREREPVFQLCLITAQYARFSVSPQVKSGHILRERETHHRPSGAACSHHTSTGSWQFARQISRKFVSAKSRTRRSKLRLQDGLVKKTVRRRAPKISFTRNYGRLSPGVLK